MKRKLAAAVLAAGVLRLAAVAGLGEAAAEGLSELLGGGGLSIRVQLGPEATPSPTPAAMAVSRVESPSPPPLPGGTPGPGAVAATEPPLPEKPRGEGIEISNATELEIDVAAMLERGTDIRLSAGSPQILIIHTHGSEAYTPEGPDRYTPTDTARTEDREFNVVRVGDELAAVLESFGLEVVHDRELYDYPSYTGSYGRSAQAVESYLAEYPEIGVVIDLHRDAIGSGDVVYKTRAELGGVSCAQVMLVMGTGANGLPHPDWRENMCLALLLQEAMADEYPTLARPLAVKSERYNQQLSKGSILLEVGSSGNTLQEALLAVRLFGEAAGPVLAGLVE